MPRLSRRARRRRAAFWRARVISAMPPLAFVGALIAGGYWLFGPTGQAPTRRSRRSRARPPTPASPGARPRWRRRRPGRLRRLRLPRKPRLHRRPQIHAGAPIDAQPQRRRPKTRSRHRQRPQAGEARDRQPQSPPSPPQPPAADASGPAPPAVAIAPEPPAAVPIPVQPGDGSAGWSGDCAEGGPGLGPACLDDHRGWGNSRMAASTKPHARPARQPPAGHQQG